MQPPRRCSHATVAPTTARVVTTLRQAVTQSGAIEHTAMGAPAALWYDSIIENRAPDFLLCTATHEQRQQTNQEMSDTFDQVLPPVEEAAAKGWQPQGLPAYPQSFEQGAFTLPSHSKKLSEIVHPHPWDARIRFVEEGHVYYLDNIQTGGSVTGLMEPYSEKFDADAACASMRRNLQRWPNPKYLRRLPSDAARYRDVLEAVAECHEEGRQYTRSLVHPVVDALPKLAVQLEVAIAALEFAGGDDAPADDDDEGLTAVQADEIARALRRLRDEAARAVSVPHFFSDNRLPREYMEGIKTLAATAIDELTMTDAEIKCKWERDGARAANEGTWTHLQLELALNRDACYKSNPEFTAFRNYVEKVLVPMGVKVWRTEFELCAPEEDLAGTLPAPIPNPTTNHHLVNVRQCGLYWPEAQWTPLHRGLETNS